MHGFRSRQRIEGARAISGPGKLEALVAELSCHGDVGRALLETAPHYVDLSAFSSMIGGFTTLTVIPFFASSSASDLDNATTAALAAAYAEIFA